MTEQITTITFFRYRSLREKVWAFKMMQSAHRHLQRTSGLEFYKLLGSGKGMGFNPWPDWSVYALLQVWDRESSAETFLNESELMTQYRVHATEAWTLFMKNIAAHGEWSGSNPFTADRSLDPADRPVAVITRATIRPSKLRLFWKYVPTSQKPLLDNPHLLYTKGIGEVPLLQMATFSLWKDLAALKQFAYESTEHREAIRKTRALDWYREELFSRFLPYRSVGTWLGRDEIR